jgi:alkaline phosphatase
LLIIFVQLALSQPKNMLFFIGDGMGFQQVKAAGMYANGVDGSLSFEAFPYQAEMTTSSADSFITDSAAAATAMATGFKVNNGVVSMAYPGDGRELETLLEYFSNRGKSTGLVTTTYITHATLAAFGAHEPDRENLSEIATDYLSQTHPNVLFGGGANGMSSVSAVQAGYTVVSDRPEMESLDTENINSVSGQFGNTHLPYEYDGLGSLPHLSEMTLKALEVLDNNPDGFFLIVEGGRIDHAGHANDIERNVFETVEFSYAVEKAIDWAQNRTDTLILVTADHETGGLAVLQNNGKGNFPVVSWSTTGHTAQNVPVYAWGENAEMVNGVMDNTDLFDLAIADTRSPKIFFTGPANGILDVPVNYVITATFSETMDESTINKNTFIVDNGVNGTVVYDTNSTTAKFTPTTDLDYDTTYTATITTDAEDLAGNALQADYLWSFTTQSDTDGSGSGGGGGGCFIDTAAYGFRKAKLFQAQM